MSVGQTITTPYKMHKMLESHANQTGIPPYKTCLIALSEYGKEPPVRRPDLKRYGPGAFVTRLKLTPSQYEQLIELATQYTDGKISKIVQLSLAAYFAKNNMEPS